MQISRKLFQKISFCDVFNNYSVANCPQSVPVEKLWKSVDVWWR